jgi:hypothetical protein
VSFLAWTFLFGAVAVAGPIVAHLLSKPRFRRVPFTMLRFLRAGQSHTHSRRRLRDLLILLMRCAIIILIAILFAQPVLYVRAKPRAQTAVYHLALDDSMSMAYRDRDKTLFERMTVKALDRIRQAPDDAAFNVYGLASGRSSHGLKKSEAMAAIKQLRVVPAAVRVTDFFSALGQASRAAAPGSTTDAVILSDFTPGTLREFEQIAAPATVDEIRCEPILAEKSADNTAIIGARLVGVTGDTISLDVTICHYGSSLQQCTLTAQTKGLDAVGKEELTLASGQRKVVRLQIDLNVQLRGRDRACLPIELSLSHGDGLVEDDTYRIAVYLPRAAQTNVVLVHRGEETFLFETALQALSSQEHPNRTTSAGALDRVYLTKVPQGRLTARDLDGEDIVVFSSLPAGSSIRAGELKTFAQKGGKLIFFTAGSPDLEPATLLSREGLLPAQPQRWVQAITYPEPRPCTEGSLALDERSARSLSNYRLDQVALKGYWLCRPAAQAQCLWRLTGGEGLLYAVPCGHGQSIFVNTSIDDSLGLLAKSSAWVAFCRCLLGETDQAQQFCFSTGERPVLHVAEQKGRGAEPGIRDERTALWVENCDGRKARAAAQGNVLVLPPPAGLGWMRTTDEPILYAGINLPAGETDLTAPSQEQIDNIVQRAFVTQRVGWVTPISPGLRETVGTARPTGLDNRSNRIEATASSFRQKPVWPIFAWAAMVLLVLESAVANRLRR